MFGKIITILLLTSLLAMNSGAQTICSDLGQNPSTAFPVCGTSIFQQSTVPICGGRQVPCPCPFSLPFLPFTDKNPFWYKFTCFSGGSLGFTITPNTLDEDYDWQLFDVTSHNPDDVFTDSTLLVACDWSGDFGITGAAAPPLGNSLVECQGPGVPLFSSMPTLIAGHNYLLLISHFSDSQSGYSLSFDGGTAVITDPIPPHLQNATAGCDGTTAMVVLNKKMKCSSLSADGSEFVISPPLTAVIAAVGNGCGNGFDLDTVLLTLGGPLPAGNYTIAIRNGNDGNTLLDNCDADIPAGENLPMVVYPFIPTPMDSISKLNCAPQTLQLVFKKGIQCSSIAPNGSDFVITGTYPVSIQNATGICTNGLARVINIQLASPLLVKGAFQIRLVRGNDGNTLIDECSQETPAGATLNFFVKDTVSADFVYAIRFGCKVDTIDFSHDGRNGVNSWKWDFDNLRTSPFQSPSMLYGLFGPKTAQLIVSNGVCSDTSAMVTMNLDNYMKATFEATAVVCPGDLATFNDNSIGHIVSWNWNFGNGKTSSLHTPPQQTYKPANINADVPVKLIVADNLGCTDSAIQKVKVAGNCLIAVAGAFTPNNDGLNDYLYPLNAYKVIGLQFKVYNRLGQLVFETADWTKRWDGSFKGQPADPGTYVWILHYTNADTGKYVEQKGTSILIR